MEARKVEYVLEVTGTPREIANFANSLNESGFVLIATPSKNKSI